MRRLLEPSRANPRACKNRAAVCALLLCLLGLAALPAQATIRYSVSVAQREDHVFRVTMTIPDVRGAINVQLPAWNALYQIRDFAYRVMRVRASDEKGAPLEITKLDKQTWRITGTGSVRVQYGVYWDEPGPFSSQLNRTHAFLNPATILFYVPERRDEDVVLAFEDLPRSWRAAAALRPAITASAAPSAFVAPNYDALADAPVELGEFGDLRFEGGGRPVRVVVHAENWNREQLADTVRRIVTYEIQLMRGAPFEEYVFLYHIGAAAAGAGGGMEHANSTAIFADSGASLAAVTAHEFFHLWNVKRIRPQSLELLDYAREQWTRALWFAEGVTSTYGAYTLVRTGLWSRRQFYDDLAAQITDLESRPARRWKSVEEASLDAWFEKYPIYRRPDLSISYYNKGQILGVLLDILIRDATDNHASLDDVLRAMDDNFARRRRFYRDSSDIQAAAEHIAGRDLGTFFSRYVAGTEELPCAETLARAGLVLKLHARRRPEFGFRVARVPDGASVVSQVESASTAQVAGMREGDILLELNGARFPRNLERWLRDHKAGETIRIRLRRGAQEKEISFALGEREERVYGIEEASDVTPKQRRIREGLLRGTTDGPA